MRRLAKHDTETIKILVVQKRGNLGAIAKALRVTRKELLKFIQKTQYLREYWNDFQCELVDNMLDSLYTMGRGIPEFKNPNDPKSPIIGWILKPDRQAAIEYLKVFDERFQDNQEYDQAIQYEIEFENMKPKGS